MAMIEYSTLTKNPELEPHDHVVSRKEQKKKKKR